MIDVLAFLSLFVLFPIGIIPLFIVALIYETKIIIGVLLVLFLIAVVKNGIKRYCVFGVISLACIFVTGFFLHFGTGVNKGSMSAFSNSVESLAGCLLFSILTFAFAGLTIVDLISSKNKNDNNNVKNNTNNISLLKIKSKSTGAELESILFDGEERLHDGLKSWNRHSPILFPIVGKLKNDETIIDGNMYHMTQHGFARDCEFETIGENSYVLRYNNETLEKYPYKFELYVSYEVIGNTLVTKYRVKNVDDKMICFGLGGHPAFVCDFNNSYLELEWNEDEAEVYQLNDGLIKRECEDRKKFINGNKIFLTPNFFDNDAVIMKKLKSKSITLFDNGTKRLKFDFSQFPILALWSKKGANFLCIEPWMNTADREDSNGRFDTKDGLVRIRCWTRFFCGIQSRVF